LREVARVQQRALALENEIEKRKEVEAALRDALEERRRSEAFLRGIVQSSDDCLKVLDLEGKILFLSQGGERALGCEAGSVIGARWAEFWQGEERRAALAALEAARQGRSSGFEGFLPTEAGSRIPSWWDIRVSPIPDHRGKPDRILVVSRDASERRGVETKRAALAADGEDCFRILVEQVRDYAIFMLDTEGRVSTWNTGAQRLKGYRAEEILGKHFSVFYPAEKVEAGFPQEELRLAARDGRFEDEGPRIRKDGTTFIANVVITALHDAQGNLRGFAKVTRDVTERFTKAEKALRESEERLRLACATAGLGVFEWEVSSDRALWENDRLYEIFGRGREEGPLTMAELSEKVLHPEDRASFEKALHEAMKPDRRFEAACRIRRKDGELRWVQYAARFELSGDGKPLRLVGVIKDITDEKGVHDALRQSEDRLLMSLDATGLGIWDFDLVTGELRWDERCKALFGLSPDAKVDYETFLSRVHPDDRARVHAEAQRSFDPASGGMQAQEYRAVVSTDGAERWIAARGRLRCDPAGRPTRMIGTVIDVTVQKLAEQALKDADRRKDEFLAMLAHELRNPLAPVTTALQLVRARAGDRDDLARPLAVMARQTQHLSKLVDDLLEVSRITRGKIRLDRDTIDASVAVNRAVEISRPLIESKKHDLQVSLPHEPLWIDADATRLAQVLGNLLNNAAKYTDQGGRIWVTCERDGVTAVFRVRDNGIGIPGELMPRLFELFTQADTSLDRSQGGLGIGLTLVRALTELHGGSVHALSEGAGKGSEFVVRLPLTTRPKSKERTGSHTRTRRIDPRRVVVVDDNLDAAETLAEFLSDDGHDVRLAYDGPSSLEAIRGHKPDVVFLDIGLPRLDGYEVARQLRREHGDRIILVALTGYGQAEDRRRTKEAGFDHHLVKPVQLEALSKVLSQASVKKT
jgi:PAS domain S-box-containing protein